MDAFAARRISLRLTSYFLPLSQVSLNLRIWCTTWRGTRRRIPRWRRWWRLPSRSWRRTRMDFTCLSKVSSLWNLEGRLFVVGPVFTKIVSWLNRVLVSVGDIDDFYREYSWRQERPSDTAATQQYLLGLFRKYSNSLGKTLAFFLSETVMNRRSSHSCVLVWDGDSLEAFRGV